MNDTEDIVRYVLSSMKKATTFRLSRTLLLLDMEWEKKHGNQRTSLRYGLFPPAFYVEEFPAMLLEMEDVEKVIETDGNDVEKGLFIFHGKAPNIDDETRALLNSIIEKTSKMDDHSLNMLVVNSNSYLKKLKEKR